ncbi:MAG TPA: histidine kinase dimerization/phospho-acceptor domain-containing protein, partial [Burkholderiaceae bacterium]
MLAPMPTNAWSPPVDDFSRYIADHVPGRIAYWDRQLRCQFVNRTFCDWFGELHDEVVGRHIVEIFDARRVASLHAHLEGALRGEVQIFDYEETRPDGAVTTMLIRYDPDIQDGEVLGFFVLALDVTLQREAERRLQRMNAELELERDKAHASALAKSRFLANMSHEIRTPLNAIIGLTHLLRRDPGTPQAPERLARVSDAAERLLGMVNDVLDLTKIETGMLVLAQVEFDLEALVASALGLVEARAREKSLALTADVASLPRLLRGDPSRLSQALSNLLANAVKFTERGSVALVGTLLDDRDDALQVRFEVRDTGVGIAGDRLDSIFNPFEQGDGSTTRRFGGSGLGLGIARHLAQLMGGD